MTPLEMIARWRKGCSCIRNGETSASRSPEECPICTGALIIALEEALKADSIAVPLAGETVRQHSHYFRDVSHLKDIDVYRVLQLFGVTDPCVQHAVKKLLVAGGRGAGKGLEQDVREAVDSLNRALQMIAEDDRGTCG